MSRVPVRVVVPSLARGGRGYAVIENVVTHPECRRLGRGSAVVGAAVEAAWAANCYKVSLATGSQRESTLRFYEKAGFQRAGAPGAQQVWSGRTVPPIPRSGRVEAGVLGDGPAAGAALVSTWWHVRSLG